MLFVNQVEVMCILGVMGKKDNSDHADRKSSEKNDELVELNQRSGIKETILPSIQVENEKSTGSF